MISPWIAKVLREVVLESQLYLVLLLPLWAIFCCMDSVGLGHPESYES